jgi:hypothetical protein
VSSPVQYFAIGRGLRSVVYVLTRSSDRNVVELIKTLDTAAAKNRGIGIIFLTDDKATRDWAREFAEKAKPSIALCVWTDDRPGTRKIWNIAEEAEVTVLLTDRLEVKQSFAFRKGELGRMAIERIMQAAMKFPEQRD